MSQHAIGSGNETTIRIVVLNTLLGEEVVNAV